MTFSGLSPEAPNRTLLALCDLRDISHAEESVARELVNLGYADFADGKLRATVDCLAQRPFEEMRLDDGRFAGRHCVGMPRYFFHVRDGDELILDHEGLELPDPEVLDECRSVVREVLHEDEHRAELVAGRQFEIVDELGRLVVTIPFRAVVVV